MIVGYGLTTAGEADRYMRHTLESLKKITDKIIILCNNATEKEKALLKEYSCFTVEDNREWGKYQNKIKEDFLRDHVAKLEPEICVAADMDEVFDPSLTKEEIRKKLEKWYAMYLFFIQHWNHPNRHNPNINFWNVRIFKWNGDVRFENRPLHPGLCPKWTYIYGSYAPYYVRHFGLMDPKDREVKVQRYNKYDPNYVYRKGWYGNLKDTTRGEEITSEYIINIRKEVASYGDQTKKMAQPKEERFFYVKRLKDGVVLDVPEKDVDITLRRGGFELVSKEPVILTNDFVRTTTAQPKAVDFTPEDSGTTCGECGFIAKNESGLRLHKRKHGGDNNREVQSSDVREGDSGTGVTNSEYPVSLDDIRELPEG